jgi:hypothetical protein
MMNANAMMKSVGVVALAALLTMSSAQACMPGMPFQSGSSGCAAGQKASQPCPAQGAQGNRGQACVDGKQELISAMGSMAAGGMEIAANVMRVLVEEADRYLAPQPGI